MWIVLSSLVNCLLLGVIVKMASSSKCKHLWKVTGWAYTPPSRREFEGNGYEAMKILNDIVHGFTFVTYHCANCHEPRTEKFPGKYYPELGTEASGIDEA